MVIVPAFPEFSLNLHWSHLLGSRPRLMPHNGGGSVPRLQIPLAFAYPFGYATNMNTFLRSEEFHAWLGRLKDKVGRARIAHRIRSAEHGNFGDCEPVGGGISEMRIHTGPGYRVYFTRRGQTVYLLLLGGHKSSQKRDIRRAIEMARVLEED